MLAIGKASYELMLIRVYGYFRSSGGVFAIRSQLAVCHRQALQLKIVFKCSLNFSPPISKKFDTVIAIIRLKWPLTSFLYTTNQYAVHKGLSAEWFDNRKNTLFGGRREVKLSIIKDFEQRNLSCKLNFYCNSMNR